MNPKRKGGIFSTGNDDRDVEVVTKPAAPESTLYAREINTYLNERVVGQEQAKLMLSVLFSMHIHRTVEAGVAHRPPNAVLVGPTGVGKTHTLRAASEFLRLPFLAIDSTTLVPSGGKGLQAGNVAQDLIAEAKSIIDKHPELDQYYTPKSLASRGVVFFDEFDKLALFTRDSTTVGNSHDSWQLMVQRGLLKFCEGSLVDVGVRGEFGQGGVFDTSGVLVIAGGAFQGIDSAKIRSQRPEALAREIRTKGIISHDFVSYGLMPELIARLQVLVEFRPLGSDDFREILDNAYASPIGVWVNHFKKLKKTVDFTDEAKDLIARRASLLNLGARGIYQVLFPALLNLTCEMETSDQKHIQIDGSLIQAALARIGM